MKHFILLIAGLLALTFFVAAYFDPVQNPVGLGSDGYEYWHLSTSILKNHQFSYVDPRVYPVLKLKPLLPMGLVPKTIPCTTRVPGYPMVLALARHAWDSPWAAIIINYLCFIGICIYGYLLGNLFLPDPRWRWIYSVLLTFSPLYFTRWGMGSEFCAGFLATAFTYHAVNIVSGSRRYLLWTIILAVLGCLTRSNLIAYTYPLLILGLLFGAMKKDIRAVLNILILLSVVTLSLNLWMVRNQILTGKKELSTQGGFVLYTVHVDYDHPEKQDPGKDLFIKNLRSGKTFNQTEAIVDQKLTAILLAHYRKHPFHLIKKGLDGLRTMFLFSYFDISDAILVAQKPFSQRLAFVNSSSSEYAGYPTKELPLRQFLFQISHLYKWALLISFFAFPFIFLAKKGLAAPFSQTVILVYVPTLTGLLLTALCTGAAGDRMRLPFNAFLLIFVVLSWMLLAKQSKNALKKPWL